MSCEPKCKVSQAANSQAVGQSPPSDSVITSAPGGAGALFLAALAFIGAAVGNSVKVRSCIAPSPLKAIDGYPIDCVIASAVSCGLCKGSPICQKLLWKLIEPI
jgi:hypothetical protein